MSSTLLVRKLRQIGVNKNVENTDYEYETKVELIGTSTIEVVRATSGRIGVNQPRLMHFENTLNQISEKTKGVFFNFISNEMTNF